MYNNSQRFGLETWQACSCRQTQRKMSTIDQDVVHLLVGKPPCHIQPVVLRRVGC